MDTVDFKYKINKYIKKGKFNIKLDESEYTYNLLKHKYINNKLIGGAKEITLNDKLLYYVSLHGKLLPKEYVKVPKNLIIILPSCCGKSNYDSQENKFDIIKKISSGKNVYDTSKPVILNGKIHFIYTEGEEICNISLTYSTDNMDLSNGIVFDMENNIHSDKEDFGLLFFKENIMDKKPLRTDDFVISENILKLPNFEDEHTYSLFVNLENYEDEYYFLKIDLYNLNDSASVSRYNKILEIIYHSQNEIIKDYGSNYLYDMIKFEKNILETDINLKDVYSTLYEKDRVEDKIGKYIDNILQNCFISSINLCVYALYFCMYDDDKDKIKATLENMTSLKLINKKLFFNFILPTYYFKDKKIIKTKLQSYDFNPYKFDLILSHIKDKLFSMCTPHNKDEETIKSYYTDIKHFIINNIIYFYPFIVYYFHGYSDLSIDFVKNINEQDDKCITLNDVFSKFSTIHQDKEKIVYINACQGSVSDGDMCYLHKCIKKHTKNINEIDIDDKTFNIKNPTQLLADIYENTRFFKDYFNSFIVVYSHLDAFDDHFYMRDRIIKFFQKELDKYKKKEKKEQEEEQEEEKKEEDEIKFIDYFNDFFNYVEYKYPIIKEYYDDNTIYMRLFSLDIIQIMYNICKIIKDNKIKDYLSEDVERKNPFIYYSLNQYYLLDKGEKELILKDINNVYDKINKEIEKEIEK